MCLRIGKTRELHIAEDAIIAYKWIEKTSISGCYRTPYQFAEIKEGQILCQKVLGNEVLRK
jgi:hypothetical protein